MQTSDSTSRLRRVAAAALLVLVALGVMAPQAWAQEGPDAPIHATIHTEWGDMRFRLFPESAPKACENFVTLARAGYYDGLTFHRVVEDFMIHGGDPDGSGYGGRSIWGGSFENEIDPALDFDHSGVLAMANRGVPNTNTSQFFVTLVPAPWLTGSYTIFGELVDGTDALQAISELDVVPPNDRPIRDAVIDTVTIEGAGE